MYWDLIPAPLTKLGNLCFGDLLYGAPIYQYRAAQFVCAFGYGKNTDMQVKLASAAEI